MGRLRHFALAGAFVVSSAIPAFAADLLEPPVIIEPPPVKVGHSWYLRGHIGMSNQQVGSLYNVLFDAASTNDLVIVDKNFEAGGIFGLGVGYRHSDKMRFDVTAEYRGETGFHGMDTWTDGDGDPRYNNYTAKKSEWLFLANGYYDLGTWHGVTPYLGAGVGASRNTIHSFRDTGIAYATPNDLGTAYPTHAYANAANQWNLAWALHAGVAFQASENLLFDLEYSYVNLGNGQTGDIIAFDGTNSIYNPMHFNDITSHDVKLSMRYEFDKGHKIPSYPVPDIVKY